MTKLRKMEIALINPQMLYFAGQVVAGELRIELSAEMKARGVRVKLRGKGHVHWSEGSGDKRRTYSASEDYIDCSVIVYGNGPESGQQVMLSEGCHVFPFQFVLPQMLPGSFEGKSSCYVRYWLKGTIDKPWKFDHEYKMMITVGSVLDLNTVQNASTPLQDADSKTVCCCCCESQPIHATLRTDKTGYVPGEAIVCDAEINDGTGRGVNSSKIKLLMKTTYMTHGGRTRKEHQECAQLLHGAIAPGGTDTFSGERLVIPPLPPSGLPGCNIIFIDYKLKLVVDVQDTPFDLDVSLDLMIGTIPLQSVVQQYMPYMQPGMITNQPVPMGAPVNFDLPPPTYQECVFGQVDTRDDDDKNATGNMNYAPAYTYYDWMNPPAQQPAQPTAPFPQFNQG